jgi:hypothetical protein
MLDEVCTSPSPRECSIASPSCTAARPRRVAWRQRTRPQTGRAGG